MSDHTEQTLIAILVVATVIALVCALALLVAVVGQVIGLWDLQFFAPGTGVTGDA